MPPSLALSRSVPRILPGGPSPGSGVPGSGVRDAPSSWRRRVSVPEGSSVPVVPLPTIPVGGLASVVAEPVRLLVPIVGNPFAPGREVGFALVKGTLLTSLGVHDGDHVALWRSDAAEHGDLAAVADVGGRAALWRVYPERDRLRLSTGDPVHARTTRVGARVRGVVVGVLRRFAD